jgi:hypothetical protein
MEQGAKPKETGLGLALSQTHTYRISRIARLSKTPEFPEFSEFHEFQKNPEFPELPKSSKFPHSGLIQEPSDCM